MCHHQVSSTVFQQHKKIAIMITSRDVINTFLSFFLSFSISSSSLHFNAICIFKKIFQLCWILQHITTVVHTYMYAYTSVYINDDNNKICEIFFFCFVNFFFGTQSRTIHKHIEINTLHFIWDFIHSGIGSFSFLLLIWLKKKKNITLKTLTTTTMRVKCI